MQKQDVKIRYTDPVTEIPLRSDLEKSWNLVRERYDKISYILFDLKDASLINAFYGYAVGDELLKYIAKTLRNFFEEDPGFPQIYRFGGDTFIIITEISPEEAFNRLHYLRQYFSLYPFAPPVGKPIHISFAAVILGVDVKKVIPEELLWIAERALIELKNVSKEGIEIVTEKWMERLYKKRESLKLFVRALEKGWITFAMQKIVDVNTGQTYAYEILARIRMDDGRIVPAGIFIEDLGYLGLDMELDEEVIDKALYYKKKKGIKDRFSLNFSNKFFDQKLNLFIELVNHYKINPEEIIIELTEREDFERITSFEEKFKMLKEIGFLIFLDDFGIGYSNFHLLQRYSFDGIKIDGQFIKNLPFNWMDRKFVEFILEISRELKVDVVAEFVESEEIVNFFRQNYRYGNGIAFLGQGYFFGKPEVLFID